MATYRVYLIKCTVTDKCYISYTDSPNEKYNPLSYLNSVYRKGKEKYIELGKSIEEHGMKNHKYMFIKTGLTKDEASEVTNKLRTKTEDRSLHDGFGSTVSVFEKELELLKDDEELTDI